MTTRNRSHRVILSLFAIFSLWIATIPSAHAGLMATESGDAGQLLGTAQSITGNGELSSISGTLSIDLLSQSFDEVDLYYFFIPDLSQFSATTVSDNTEFLDTQLYLFDSSGLGVAWNDDTSFNQTNATLNTTNYIGSGNFYLAVTEFGDFPFSSSGPIFGFPPLPGETVGPLGTGASNSLSGWTTDGFSENLFTPNPTNYEILLQGAEAISSQHVIPAPAAIHLMIVFMTAMGTRWFISDVNNRRN